MVDALSGTPMTCIRTVLPPNAPYCELKRASVK